MRPHHSTVRHASHSTHHSRRPDAQSSSSAILRQPDCTASLTRTKRKGCGRWLAFGHEHPRGNSMRRIVSAPKPSSRGTHVGRHAATEPHYPPQPRRRADPRHPSHGAGAADRVSRSCSSLPPQRPPSIASATPCSSITSRRACPTGLLRASPSRAGGWPSSSTFSTASRSKPPVTENRRLVTPNAQFSSISLTAGASGHIHAPSARPTYAFQVWARRPFRAFADGTVSCRITQRRIG